MNTAAPAINPVYLDCAATTPIDPAVAEIVKKYMVQEFGNPGSHTHQYGSAALKAVSTAREQVAAVVNAQSSDVIFTSGATESNNLAILGLATHGNQEHRRHIVSTQIEHKAILEPLEQMQKQGFEVTLIPPNSDGWVEPQKVTAAVREDTLLVSVMHVNNETGVIQPVAEIAEYLGNHPAFFHTDAAQGFGKEAEQLKCEKIDLISISGHKIHAPKGIGALILRRRNHRRPPLTSIMYGGGQERGIRPGTLASHLIVGLGVASENALTNWQVRHAACIRFKEQLVAALKPLNPHFNGDMSRTVPNIINMSFDGLDSEAAMLSLKEYVAISNGSACTSQTYQLSHVLLAMGLSDKRAESALRWSWCHMSETPDWQAITKEVGSYK